MRHLSDTVTPKPNSVTPAWRGETRTPRGRERPRSGDRYLERLDAARKRPKHGIHNGLGGTEVRRGPTSLCT